ncbi:MAG: rhomboid family intramembrane serine protease [Planctomycetes bacterium]|nr:rhomboid family intramembrane serine protease [Planctomycetota bacterium]
MGIYDRDYIRRPPPGAAQGRSPLTSMRMWSVNTWLIVICVAVFVIDEFTPRRLVLMQTVAVIEPQDFAALDASVLVVDKRTVTHRDSRGRPVLGRQSVYLDTPQGRVRVAVNHLQGMRFIESFLHFSTARGFIKMEFWRLIGFQFLHAGLGHLFFNMLALYFFGSMVEQYLGSKRYLAFYLLCGIFGALMYCLLNLSGYVATQFFGSDVQIRGLLFNNPNTPLIGASAGVFGVLMAGAFLAPNATVLLFLFLPMRLRTLAYALVALALFWVIRGGPNAGGEAGHLGGAIAGFYFIRHPQHLHGFFDILGRVDPTSHHYRGKRGRSALGRSTARRGQVDRILDKISAGGLHSLTEKEKRILREASQKEI